MDFYFFILIVCLGVSYQVFLNRRRSQKIGEFLGEIRIAGKDIISRTDEIVNKLAAIEKRFEETETAERNALPEKYVIVKGLASVESKYTGAKPEDLEMLLSGYKKIDERFFFQIQRIGTYYHSGIQRLLEIVQPELTGVGRYFRKEKLIDYFGVYQEQQESEKEEKRVVEKYVGREHLTLIKGKK